MTDETKTIIEAGLAEVKAKLDAKLSEHTAEIEKHGKAATHLTGEIDKLSGEFKSMQDKLTEIAQRQTAAPQEQKRVGSIGAQFSTDERYLENIKSMMKNRNESISVEVKNTTITSDLSAVFSDGTTVFPQQRQGVISGDFTPTTIRDVLNVVRTIETNSVNALREASWTNSAAETAQGAAKPESEIEFENYNVPIQTIPHFIKVSRQLMADAPAVAAYIDGRLRHGLAARVDRQIILGNGTSPNLSGLTDSGNFTAFTPTSGENLADSINRAKYLQWAATGIPPDAVVVNPADWGALERLREGTNTGMYLYGAPGTPAGGTPFGVRVVMNINVAAGTFIIGNMSQGVTLFDRESITVTMGYVNDDFTRNLVTILAEERLALAVERPSLVYYGDITAS